MPDPGPPATFPPLVMELITRELTPRDRESLSQKVSSLKPSDRQVLFELLEELVSTAPKPTATGLARFASVMEAFGPAQANSWLDLGVSLAARSGAAARKYFNESFDLLAQVSPSLRPHLLNLGLELSEGPYGAIMDFLRACPELPDGIDPEHLSIWIQSGILLCEEDLVLGVEYFRISPELLKHLPAANLPLWVQVGRHLVEPNSLGKTDYMKVIEYFRLSLQTLLELEPPDLRRPFLEMSATLARISASAGMDFFRSCPSILRKLESPIHRRLLLAQGRRLAEQDHPDSSLILDYLRSGPGIFEMLGDSPDDFIAWVDTGLGMLARNPQRARAYFSGRSKASQEATEQLIGGVSLQAIGRVLTLFAEGLSGRPVTIRPTTALPENMRQMIGDSPTTDGRTIFLPPRIRYFPEDQDNFRIYKMATLHEAGHLEYETYHPRMEELQDLTAEILQNYPNTHDTGSEVLTLNDFLQLFPDPGWARFLWTILEDARVDHLLRENYPGVRSDMDRIIRYDLESRPKLEGLPPQIAIREALLQLSLTDTTEVSMDLAETVSGAYDLLTQMKKTGVSSTDSLRMLARLYPYLEQRLRQFQDVQGESNPLQSEDQSPLPESSSGEGQGEKVSMPSTAPYRGEMHPEWVQNSQDDSTQPIDPAALPPRAPESVPEPSTRGKNAQENRDENHTPDRINALGQAGATRSLETPPSEEKIFFYDEWDYRAQEYRPAWCRLYEHRLQPESNPIVGETLSTHAPMIRLLRRYFEGLRPESFKKLKRQTSGDDLDLDAVVEGRTEIRSGRLPDDRMYIKKEKKVRDVAVCFLVDMSGSTRQQIRSADRRVIQIEQEAMILMSEALEAVGDLFAIYGFSGHSKDRVDFYVMKDFADVFNPATHEQIGAMRSLNQNRDGAAIRHAITKLEQISSKTRLLILLSDGKPLDTDYTGAYSLQDTKTALREARLRGIHPYCITVDQQREDTDPYIAEMYGDVSYTIIDQVSTLPDKLPRIYRRLTT